MTRIPILISAAGTASGYHIFRTIKRRFADKIAPFACDTNPRHLVACSDMCDGFFQVPPVTSPDFLPNILSVIKSTGAQLHIPLIDHTLNFLPSDSPELLKLNCRTASAPSELTSKVTDKLQCFEWLQSKGVATPRLIGNEDVEPEERYFVEPRRGFGSRGTREMTGREILDCQNGVELLVQEICRPPEITIEIFKLPTHTESICRERIKTNTGVCTKTRVFKDDELHQLVLRIIENESWPVASCIQIMRNHRDELAVIDVNLRIGAGTAMSAAVGWDLVSALLAAKLDLDPRPERFLNFDGRQRHVVRVYEEFVTD